MPAVPIVETSTFRWLLMLWLLAGLHAQEVARKLPNSESRPIASAPNPRIPLEDLVAGERAMNSGDFRGAESDFRRALVLTGIDDEEGRRIQTLIRQAVKAQSQMSQIDEIERMISAGEMGAASQSLAVLAKDADNGLILGRIEDARARSHSTWKTQLLAWSGTLSHRLLTVAGWVVFVLILLLLVMLGRRLDAFRRARKRNPWRLGELMDSTKLGIGPLVAYHFSALLASRAPASVTNGLMSLAAPMIPASPGFRLAPAQVDLIQELQSSSLTLSGVNVGAAAGVFKALENWWKASDNVISGVADISGEKQLTLRLTARSTAGKPIAVEAAAPCADSRATRLCVEGATFKMLYAIQQDGDVEGAERADLLRQGMLKLRTYVNGGDPAHDPLKELRGSVEAFAGVRAAWPASLEAHLYEGIALDLLEAHREAIEHFQYVRENSTDPAMSQKALYNEAVAHLRSWYKLPGINRCIELVDELVSPGAPAALKAALLDDPVKALALGVKADAIAHRPIHWKKLGTTLAKVAAQSLSDVTQITDLLDEIAKDVAGKIRYASATAWDRQTLRQLEWSVQNALGDLNLNCATSLHAVDPTAVPPHYVQAALKALNRCAVLLPPGVETLSNLGTAYLVSADTFEARRYLQRVIRLNKYYEYAYYRLAQTWEFDKRPQKAAGVVKEFPGVPQIPEFIELFDRYHIKANDE